MNIRPATPADADGIAEIQISGWRQAYRGLLPDATLDELDVSQAADKWSRVLSAPHSMNVAVSDSSVVGFCWLTASRDDDATPGPVGEIGALYIHPRRWRSGVGRALCAHAIADAAKSGYSSVTLWTLAANTRAISFYTAVGFVPDGATKTEQVTTDCIVDELRMRRAIPHLNNRDPIMRSSESGSIGNSEAEIAPPANRSGH